MPDDAQPVEGQGDEGTGSPYDSYLQAVPEQAKDAAEAWFRDTSKGLDAKLQEAAELKKTWEPYTPVQEALAPFRDNPEQLSELIGWWQQVTADDGAYRDWLANAAKEAGITPEEEQALEAAEVEGELTREEVSRIIDERTAEQIGPVQAEALALRQEKQVDEHLAGINEEIGRIQKEMGVEFSKDDRAAIFELGTPFMQEAEEKGLPPDDQSWVMKGVDRWKDIGTRAQQAFVAEKSGQPTPAVTRGGTEAFKPITTMEGAREALRERLRQQS